MDERPPVLSKVDFVRRYQRGEFGNCSPTWDNLDELSLSGYRGRVHLRNRVAGGPTWYNVHWFDVHDRAGEVTEQGLVAWRDLYFSGMSPHEYNVLQGEVQILGHGRESGLYLLYSTEVGIPMRPALIQAAGQHLTGINAAMALRRSLCPNSLDWLYYLLEAYPGHVVEFSSFSRPWGTLYPRFNTTFWEVRAY